MVPRGRDTLPPRTGFRGAFHTKTSGETPIVRWSGERPVYAGRFNMEKRELLGEGRADTPTFERLVFSASAPTSSGAPNEAGRWWSRSTPSPA